MHLVAIESQGHQQRDFLIHELERRRQDADDFAGIAIHHDAAAQNRAVSAEARFPIAVGEHHGAVAFRVVIGGGEAASQGGLHIQNGEQAMGHGQDGDFFRLGEAGYARRFVPPHADVLKHAAFLAVNEVQRRGHVEVLDIDAGRGVPQRDELPGVRIRQRLQQHAFDHAEDRRVGADADGQRHERNGGEHRRPRQPAQGMA